MATTATVKPADGDPEGQGQGLAAGPTRRRRSSLLWRARQNLAFRSVWSELNGAMGDLGTYIPIVLSVALSRHLDLGTTLVFTGIYNAVTGLIYGVPMPVQPMKAIAAAALSDPSFAIPEIMAAGILTAGFVLFLGVTRLMKLVYWIVPLPVVRGIQLAQGLNFAMAAVKYILYEQDLSKGKASMLERRPWMGFDGLVLAIAAICFILLVNGAGDDERQQQQEGGIGSQDDETNRHQGRRREKILRLIPSAVIVFVLGVAFAVARHPAAVRELRAGPSRMRVVHISREAWKQGFLKGAVPQIPLSVLNSVLAVCKLTRDLFPEKEASATSVSVTMGAMNLVGCWFGAMPCCHGAGGLAGQYKFGGRSGGCVAALGALKLALGLALGGSMLRVLVQFPVGLLGVLLLFAGVELAIAARDMSSKAEAFVMLLCTAVSLVGSNAALGFLCAMVAHGLFMLRAWLMGVRFP